MLLAEFKLENASIRRTHCKTFVVAEDASKSILLKIKLPPQHIAEEAVQYEHHNPPIAYNKVRSLGWAAARASRVVFLVTVPGEIYRECLWSVPWLIDFQSWKLSVPSYAILGQKRPGTGTNELYTNIELPFGLDLIPDPTLTAVSRPGPSCDDVGPTPLWHVRFASETGQEPALHGQRINTDPEVPPAHLLRTYVTPVADPKWDLTPECPGPTGPDEPRSLLPSIVHRRDISQQSLTAPVPFRDLMLSSRGGYLNLNAVWPNKASCSTDQLNVNRWEQRTSWGRDAFVLVSVPGYLWPFGHPASLITVRERIPRALTEANSADVGLIQEYRYIKVEQPTIEYQLPPDELPDVYGRQVPFDVVNLLTRETPRLEEFEDKCHDDALWPKSLDGKEVVFELEAIDRSKGTKRFQTPLFWVNRRVSTTVDFNPMDSELKKLRDDLVRAILEFFKKRPNGLVIEFNEQRVAAVPQADAGPSETKPFDVALPTRTMSFGLAVFPRFCLAGDPTWFKPDLETLIEQRKVEPNMARPGGWDWPLRIAPILWEAKVRLDAVAAFSTSGGGGEDGGCTVRLNPTYAIHGFGSKTGAPNLGHVFLDLDAVPLDHAGAASGGTVSPSMSIAHISRRSGPVGAKKPSATPPPGPGSASAAGRASLARVDNSSAIAGEFRPEEFFGGAAATLLGAVDLKEVIAPILEAYKEISRVPKMVASEIKQAKSAFEALARQLAGIKDIVEPLIGARRVDWSAPLDSVRGALAAWQADLRAKLRAQIDDELASLRIALDAEIDRVTGKTKWMLVIDHLEAIAVEEFGPLRARSLAPVKINEEQFRTAFKRAAAFLDVTTKFRDLVIRNVPSSVITSTLITDLGNIKTKFVERFREEISRSAPATVPTGNIDDCVGCVERTYQRLVDASAKTWSNVVTNLRDAAVAAFQVLSVKPVTLQQFTDAFDKIVAALKLKDELASVIVHHAKLLDLEGLRDRFIDELRAEFRRLNLQASEETIQCAYAGFQQILSDINDLERYRLALAHNLQAAIDGVGLGLLRDLSEKYATIPESMRKLIDTGLVSKLHKELWPTRLETTLDSALGEVFRAIEDLAKLPLGEAKSVLDSFIELVKSVESNPVRGLGELIPRCQAILDQIDRLREAIGVPPEDPTFVKKFIEMRQASARALIARLEQAINNAKSADPRAALQAWIDQDWKDTLQHLLHHLNGDLDLTDQLIPTAWKAYEHYRSIVGGVGIAHSLLLDWVQARMSSILADTLGPALSALAGAQGLIVQWVEQLAIGAAPLYGRLVELRKVIGEVKAFLEQETSKELSFEQSWNPQLRDAPAGDPVFVASLANNPATLALHTSVRMRAGLGGVSPPSAEVSARLTNFTIRLIPGIEFLKIGFSELSFRSLNGGKPEVKTKIAGVTFGEALGFVSDLAKALNPSTGPYLKLGPGMVEAGFRFPIPSISTGGFNLSDVKIGTGCQLWFDSRPLIARFALCERDKPFVLSVGVLGGGGFFALEATPRSVIRIEGSMEFGAVALLDIGVARGRVSITAGIYFSLSPGTGDATLTGFFRACGELRVIGLINVTITFYLGLGYEKRNGKSYAVGEAYLTVDIEFFFFSISVTLRCRKEVEGGSEGHGVPASSQRDSALRASAPGTRLLRDSSAAGQQIVQRRRERSAWYARAREGWVSHHRAFIRMGK